jgi:hypothetical protein
VVNRKIDVEAARRRIRELAEDALLEYYDALDELGDPMNPVCVQLLARHDALLDALDQIEPTRQILRWERAEWTS